MSIAVENYLKRIYVEQELAGGSLAALGSIADSLGVTPGTVTTMIKGLAASGLVDYQPRRGVSLTEAGRMRALAVIRRHRLIELFLVEKLGFDWADVHAEAEELEHALSDRLLDRIDAVLGHPTVDPHGDPIPRADGRVATVDGLPVSDMAPGTASQVLRITRDEPELLGFLGDAMLLPGAQLRVEARSAAAGTVTVSVGGQQSIISREVASHILVARNPAGGGL